MNINRKYNEAVIKQFRKELKLMLNDIKDIDAKVLNKSVNIGLKDIKKNTPVGLYSNQVNFVTKDGRKVSFSTKNIKQGGFLRKSWKSSRISKSKKGVTKSIYNNVDYAGYVNYGHRIVNKSGETVGFIKGQFMLENAIDEVDKEMVKAFKEEVERVNKKHGK